MKCTLGLIKPEGLRTFGNNTECLNTYSGVKVTGVANSDGKESMGLVQDRTLVGGSK